MADLKHPVVKADPWHTDQSTWEYVTIPTENAIGEPHPKLYHNRNEYEAGKTYLVPPPVAEDIHDRLRAYARSVIRMMRPNVDVAAQRAVAIGSANSAGSQPVDATKITTQP